jgi:hypothetical protein
LNNSSMPSPFFFLFVCMYVCFAKYYYNKRARLKILLHQTWNVVSCITCSAIHIRLAHVAQRKSGTATGAFCYPTIQDGLVSSTLSRAVLPPQLTHLSLHSKATDERLEPELGLQYGGLTQCYLTVHRT